jgi:hypothetical protein
MATFPPDASILAVIAGDRESGVGEQLDERIQFDQRVFRCLPLKLLGLPRYSLVFGLLNGCGGSLRFRSPAEVLSNGPPLAFAEAVIVPII